MKIELLEKILLEKHPNILPNLIESNLESFEIKEKILAIEKKSVVPENLILFYRWKNGTKLEFLGDPIYKEIHPNCQFLPCWWFMPFELSIDTFKKDKARFKFGNNYFFPIFYDGYEHCLSIKLGNLDDKTSLINDEIFVVPQRRHYTYGNYLFYKSFDIMIDCVIQGFQSGIYMENSNGILISDSLKEIDLNYSRNPESSHWHLKKTGELIG